MDDDDGMKQKFTKMEASMHLMEDSIRAMGARMKTLEKNNPLEARLRLLEARLLSTDAAKGSSVSIQKFWDPMISLLRWMSNAISVVGRTTTSSTRLQKIMLSQKEEQQQPAALSPLLVSGTSNTDVTAVGVTSVVDDATVSASPSTAISSFSATPSNLTNNIPAARKDEVRSCVSPATEEERDRKKNDKPFFRFVLKPGLDGYSQSLQLIDIEDCDQKTTGKLSDRAKIRLLHKEAVKRGLDNYDDPATGYEVFTAHHLKTRDCCGSSCRHCPWGHRNVPGKKRRRASAAPPLAVSEDAKSGSEEIATTSAAVAARSLDDITEDTETSAVEKPIMIAPPANGTVPPKSRLYTRKGDSGWGTLYNNVSILKSDGIYEAIGTVDELNSVIGFAAQMLTTTTTSSLSTTTTTRRYNNQEGKEPVRLKMAHKELEAQLETVQAWLLDVGSSLCTPRTTTFNARKLQRTKGVRHTDVVILEGWIDEADAHLARLSSFILPGGSPGASALHVARTVCRRAERHTWPLLMAGHGDEVLGIFLNRLSDFLFVAARLDAANSAGGKEQEYKINFRVDHWQRQVVNA